MQKSGVIIDIPEGNEASRYLGLGWKLIEKPKAVEPAKPKSKSKSKSKAKPKAAAGK